jgi:4-amino-4-deoxy-L-arabinose transferase-like glycosyltransferase
MLAGLTYLRTGNPRALLAAGVVLGIGFYSYVGAVPLMPLYMFITCVALWRRRDSPTRYLTFAAGFVIPIAIGLPRLVRNPAAFQA